MGGVFGGGGASFSTTQTALSGLQVQNSGYGVTIPITYGMTRVPPTLIWYGNFQAIPNTSTTTSGGKGGGGVTSSNTTYTYTTGMIYSLGEGAIVDVKKTWIDKRKYSDPIGVGMGKKLGTYPQAAWTWLTTFAPTKALGYSGIAYLYNSAFACSAGASTGNHSYEVAGILYDDFNIDANQASIITDFLTNVNYGIVGFDSGKIGNLSQFSDYCNATGIRISPSLNTQQAANLWLTEWAHTGNSGIVWSEGKLKIIPYSDTAVTGAYYTGTPITITASISGTAMTVTATSGTLSVGQTITGLNVAHGQTITASAGGGTGVYTVSISQTVVSETMKALAPTAITFTPDNSVAYNLTDDDFIVTGANDPITVTRKKQADAFNHVQVEYLDRSNDYNVAIAEVKDQANIEAFGLRSMPVVKLNSLTTKTAAITVAQTILQRVLYIRNEYKFDLTWKYARIEPMDILTINDVQLGLSVFRVRVTEVDESADGIISITAEEFPLGVTSANAYTTQTGGDFVPNYSIAPSSTNSVVIFDAPGIMTVSGFEIWIAASGGTDWGGAQVHVSTDGGTTYRQVGSIHGSARYGVLGADFQSGVDPDTINTCQVDLSVSNGTLLSGSQTDADNLNNLALIYDGTQEELLSFANATMTSTNHYTLSGAATKYIRRGVYNTFNVKHLAGTPFVRLDNAIFKYPYDPALVGTTINIKLVPFNQYIGGLVDIATVTAIPFIIDGSITYPSNVTGFTASQNGNVVVFQWNKVSDPLTYISGYEFRYAKQGTTDWNAGVSITKVTKGTQITTAKVPPGIWVLMCCAVDISNNASRIPAYYNITVKNSNVVVYSEQESPSWEGTLTNMVKHWAGSIFPQSTMTAAASAWDTFDVFVPFPFATCEYEHPVIDAGYDVEDRTWADIAGFIPPTSSGVFEPHLMINYSLAAGPYSGWQDWTIGTVTAEFTKLKIKLITSEGIPCISSFIPTIDALETTQSGTATIAAAGTAVVFPVRFHNAPVVSATATGATSLVATVASTTATGFTSHVFNSAGTDVGGVITWAGVGV